MTFVLTLVLHANAIYSVLYIIEGQLKWTGKHYTFVFRHTPPYKQHQLLKKFQNLLLQSVVFGLPVHGMFWRVETVNKAIFVIELNPLQSVIKSSHQALHWRQG